LPRRGIVLCVSRVLFHASLFMILFALYVSLRVSLSLALEWAGFGGEDILSLITCCFDQVLLCLATQYIS